MKANEVPENLYLLPNGLISYCRNTDKDVEYTRTDAFIENAQLFLIDKLKEIPMGSNKMKIKAECSLDEFVEKFRKYMEGE